MDISTIGSVGAITVICMLVATIVKSTKMDSKWIPALCGIMGAVLGVASFYLMPDFPAQDLISAVAVGIVSGLAATGVHQTYRQLKK